MPMTFRDRDGVCISYEVHGRTDDPAAPFVDGLPTLRAAIEIARKYPVGPAGDTVHVVRRYSKLLAPENRYRYQSGYTHLWRVFPDGQALLAIAYARDWPTTRQGIDEFRQALPVPRAVAPCLAGQLWDIALIAEGMGMQMAHDELLAQLMPWRRRRPAQLLAQQGRDEMDGNTTCLKQYTNKGRRAVLKRIRICARYVANRDDDRFFYYFLSLVAGVLGGAIIAQKADLPTAVGWLLVASVTIVAVLVARRFMPEGSPAERLYLLLRNYEPVNTAAYERLQQCVLARGVKHDIDYRTVMDWIAEEAAAFDPPPRSTAERLRHEFATKGIAGKE